MSTRKDLPNPNAPNFLQRVREEIHALLGKTGSARDRALTLADAIASGVITTGAGGSLVPGPGVTDVYEPDLTSPPQPDLFTATPAISHILIEQPAPTYTQGHGHLRTRVYGATHVAGEPLPVFADAVEVGQFEGTIWALASNPSTTWHLWIKWESRDGELSATPAGGANGVVATTGQDVSRLVLAMTGPGNPFKVVTSQTTLPDGSVVPVGTYTADAYIHNGQITNAKIANLAVDDAKIANLSVSKLTAGSIAVGRYAQSTGYVAGSSGWRINGDGTAEFSGVVVRGTIFASQGEIGGITIASNAVRAGQSGFNAGQGFYIGSDGTLSIGDSAGERIVWDGSSLEIETADFGLAGGNARFSGDISGATGSFSGTLLAGTIDVTQLVGQTFTYSTPGTHYVVVPESFTRMRITAVGGGAGGGAGGGGVIGGGGGGGGGGGLSIATFTVTPGSLITVYVGAGGGPGVAGQDSSVYQYISAGYGLPGGNGSSNMTAGAGGSVGSGTTTTGNAGAPGTPGYQNYSCSYDQKTGLVDSCTLTSQGPGVGGAGGASKFAGYGAGGRGGNGQTGAGRTGGANGFVQIEFFNPNGVIIRSDWDTLQSALLRQGIQVV